MFFDDLQEPRASKPTKTLQGIEKTGKINISDPEVASEFEIFMKQTDPEGFKKLEQQLELDNFDPKGRKKNATGGRIGLKAGMTKRNFLKLMGSVGAGIGAVKSGIFSGFGKGAGKQVAKEVVAAKPEPVVEENVEDLSLEDYFQHFVVEHQDSMSETELAQKLGISRKCLWERRQRLGIPRPKKGAASAAAVR